jgi:formamidopyrimidine-DNA glycosylase
VRGALREGLANRGTSISDYVSADGEPGMNAERLRVYQRTGEPCLRCGTRIERIVVGQRSTHFCPRCQRAATDDGTT